MWSVERLWTWEEHQRENGWRCLKYGGRRGGKAAESASRSLSASLATPKTSTGCTAQWVPVVIRYSKS